jgi:gamma-glutamyltranspeptidase/glutathione hydrolase
LSQVRVGQSDPGRLLVPERFTTPCTREHLESMGYDLETVDRVYNPTMAIWFDRDNDTMQGGASDYGDDYGIAW